MCFCKSLAICVSKQLIIFPVAVLYSEATLKWLQNMSKWKEWCGEFVKDQKLRIEDGTDSGTESVGKGLLYIDILHI